MFNILLIVAGILEYILLGIDFKVCSPTLLSCSFPPTPVPYRITSKTLTSEGFL